MCYQFASRFRLNMDPVVPMLFINLCHCFIAMISVIPVYDDFAEEELAFLWNCFGNLFRVFLCTCIFGLPMPVPRLYSLLFPDYVGHAELNPRDLFSDLERDPPRFFRMSGETPESLMEIVTDLDQYITNQGHGRRHRHATRNRVLLVMIWLRQYPTYDVLSSLFNISPTAITRDISVITPLLWYYFRSQISWPTVEEWLEYRGRWQVFPSAVGAIDGTLHEIRRPLTEPQHEFYSGYSRYHCMSTQVGVPKISVHFLKL